jgi:hypothetical protein
MRTQIISQRDIVWIALFVLFCSTAYGLQTQLDTTIHRRQVEEFTNLPTGKSLSPLLAGFDLLAADYYWIRTVLYFGRYVPAADMPVELGSWAKGNKAPYTGEWEKPALETLYPALNLVTDLDPLFVTPYTFGGLFLSSKAGEVQQALDLLAKGREHCPDNWRIPYIQGYNYLFHLNDGATALEHFVAASRLPECHSDVEMLIKGITSFTDKKALMLQFLTTTLETEEHEDMRERIRAWIERLRDNSE